MLKILAFFLVTCFIIGVIKELFDTFKDVILGLLGIGIIVAAIVFLGPTLLAFLPWILLVLVALFVLGCIVSFFTRCKYRSQLKVLDKLGIDKITASPEIWQGPEKLGLVETTSTGYVISTAFYKKVISKIGRTSTLTKGSLENYCIQSAEQFQSMYIGPFLDFLQRKGLLLPFSCSDRELRYLSKPFIADCETLFLKEGAATEQEFVEVCAKADIAHDLCQDNQRLAVFILEHMLSCGEIQKVELSEMGDSLYVAVNQQKDSKMTRREISLN